MHDAVLAWVTRCIDELDLADAAAVADFGGRDVNGTTRHLWPDAHYVAVDLADGPGVDVVANAATVDLGETFDVVVSTELLEHTPFGAEIVANAYRHLAPGGVFVATMAGPGRSPHGAGGEQAPPPGEWYRNVSVEDLDGWIAQAGFTMWTIDDAGTDVRCWAHKGR